MSDTKSIRFAESMVQALINSPEARKSIPSVRLAWEATQQAGKVNSASKCAACTRSKYRNTASASIMASLTNMTKEQLDLVKKTLGIAPDMKIKTFVRTAKSIHEVLL